MPKGLPVFIRCHVGSPGNDGFGPRHSLRRVERPAAFDQLFRRCNGTRLDAGAEVFEKVPEVFSLDSLRHEPPPQGTPGSTAPRLRIPRPTRRRTVRRWRSRSRRRKAHRSPFPEWPNYQGDTRHGGPNASTINPENLAEVPNLCHICDKNRAHNLRESGSGLPRWEYAPVRISLTAAKSDFLSVSVRSRSARSCGF